MKTMEKLAEAENYYDKFSRFYDILSPDWYYRKPREFAVRTMKLEKGQTILNLPVGTGQIFDYFQQYLKGSGKIVGIDLSEGMLEKARQKVIKNDWSNIDLIKAEAIVINADWVKTQFGESVQFDAVLCDLGLSGFPDWQRIIDNLLSVLRPGGKIVVMDWYIEKPGLRAEFIKWIGGGEVNRPIYQYLAEKVIDFQLNDSFKGGDVFVAFGAKKYV